MNFNTQSQNKPLGLLFIVVGLTILILVAGSLLLRLLVAFLALLIINSGMRMYGMQPAQQILMRAWFNRSRW